MDSPTDGSSARKGFAIKDSHKSTEKNASSQETFKARDDFICYSFRDSLYFSLPQHSGHGDIDHVNRLGKKTHFTIHSGFQVVVTDVSVSLTVLIDP